MLCGLCCGKQVQISAGKMVLLARMIEMETVRSTQSLESSPKAKSLENVSSFE